MKVETLADRPAAITINLPSGRRTITNSPAMMPAISLIVHALNGGNDKLAMEDFTLDLKLALLAGRVGSIGNTMPRFRQHAIIAVGCAAFAWLLAMRLPEMDIYRRIGDERLRQRQLFAERKHRFMVDSKIVDDYRKLRVLVEELGEVAEAIDELEAHSRSRQHRAHLIEELVQVAAVCVAWLESFEPATSNPQPATK